MNWDVIEGKWDQLKGDIRSKWGKLTDDDLTHIGGKKDTFVGKLQERYGIMKDAAERQIDEWMHSMNDDVDKDDDVNRRPPPRRTPGAPPR